MDPRLLATSAGWGVVAAGVFSVLRAWRRRHFDAGRTALVFIASASLPSYGRLLYAAFIGSVVELPPDWPTFAGLAAVVALGLAIQQLLGDFRAAVERAPTTRAQVSSEDASGDAE